MQNGEKRRKAAGRVLACAFAAVLGVMLSFVPGAASVAYASSGNVASVTTGSTTTGYATLQGAIDAAGANSTVKLLADVANSNLTDGKFSVKTTIGGIDFCGHTVNGMLAIYSSGSIGKLSNTVNGSQVSTAGGGGISTPGTKTGFANNSCAIWNLGTIDEIEGGYYYTAATGNTAVTNEKNFGTGYSESGSGTVNTVSGGTFDGPYSGMHWPSGTATTITGGTFKGSAAISSTSSNIVISGGLFSANPSNTSATITSGYVVQQNSDSMYEVFEPVAQVASTNLYYKSLKLAVDAVNSGSTDNDTVKLLKDSTSGGNVTISITKSMTIDGQNHSYIRDNAEPTLIAVSGSGVSVAFKDITIDGGAVWSGETDSVLGRGKTKSGITAKRQLLTVSGSATVTLESGTVLQNNYKEATGSGTANYSADTGSAVWLSGGTLIMNTGAAIKNNVCTGSTVCDGAAVCSRNAADVFTMNGGSISGNDAGRWMIRMNGTFNMNGGTITGNTAGYTGGTQTVAGVAMVGTGKANFSGGTITGNYNTLDNSKSDFAQGSVLAVVKSGFDGTVGIADLGTTTGVYTSKGQTFATLENDSATYTGEFINDENDELLDLASGTNVIWGDPVAQVTAPDGTVTKYATIAEAVAAANAAGTSADKPATIKLLDDVTENGTNRAEAVVNITGYVTIDLNGKTLTQENSGCPVISIASGAATVTDTSTGETKGTLSGGSSSIYGAENTKLTVDADVNFKDMAYYSIHTNGATDLSAGNYSYGSSVTSGESIQVATSGSYTLTGGTYKGDPSTISGVTIADGYKVVNNGDGTYTVTKIDDYVKLAGHSLTLDGAIGLNFYYELDSSITVTANDDGTYTLPDGYSMTFSVDGTTENASDCSQTVFTKKGTLDGKTVYGCSVYLKSYQQTNDLDSTLTISKSGTTLDTVTETDYSAFDYMNSVVGSTSDTNLVKLMQTLANYDACAFAQFCSGQTYTGTGDVVVNLSSEMSGVDAKVASFKQTVGDQGSYTMKHWGGSVQCQSENALAPYAKLPDGVTDPGTVVLKYRKSGASEWSTATCADGGNNFVYGYTAKIPCAELDDTYELQFCNTDGTALSPIKTMSAYTWVGTVTRSSSQTSTMKNLARSLYLYGEAANAYFGSN